MKQSARTTLPLVLSSAVGLSAVTLMFVAPTEAAPTPSTFSADVSGEVWRVNSLDLDMSGDPVKVDVAIARARGLLASAASPDRARAVAQNLDAVPAPSGLARLESIATQTQDTAGTRTAAGAAGTITGIVDYTASTLTARGRWGGDTSCLDASLPLTASKSISQGSGIVPSAIPEGTPPLLPIPIPTEIPTEIPTTPPTDFPTELPSDLPTLPVPVPTSELTSILPSVTDVTTLLPVRPGSAVAAAAEGDVSMATVAAASVEELTQLQTKPGSTTMRRVYAETIGKVTDPSKPVATFFGGEATLQMTGAPKLSAYSDGGTNGSQVAWTPPVMTLTVGGTEYEVPSGGTALALPYSKNQDVVLTVSAGKLSSAESPQGVLAQAEVSVLDVLIKIGDTVVLDADLFPMSVKAVAPVGGVDCTPVAAPDPVKPGLTLTGKDNGRKPDKVVAKAITKASGARATLFKVVNGKQKKVTSGRLDAKGDRVFKVKDRNGRKKTTYVVRILKTDLTLAGKASKKVG